MIFKNLKLRDNLKKLLKKTKNIEDVLLFGSALREKRKPSDIDILVLFKTEVVVEELHLIRKEIELHYRNVQVVARTLKNISDTSFDARESYLFEAKSLITQKNLAEECGFSALGMFKYKFDDWTKLQKTKFYYALNGRGKSDGVKQLLNCIRLSDNVLLVPLNNIDEFKDFLESWKLKYIFSPLLIPDRMNNKEIIEQN